MGASRDRVLIIARGECRASNHQVAPVLQAVEPGTRSPACCVNLCSRNVVVDRIAFARNRAGPALATPGFVLEPEWKCSHPLRNHFGSNALITAVLLRSSESRKLFTASASAQARALPTHPRAPRREHPRARRRGRGLVVIRPNGFVRSCGRTRALQTIVMVELQLGVRTA